MEETEAARAVRFLPQLMQEAGYEFRLFMPCFGMVNARRFQLHEVIRLGGTNIKIGSELYPLTIKAASIQSARIQIYFVNNEECFKRRFEDRDENGVFYADNHTRMVFFARGTLHTIKKQIWQPVVVHCHGWFSMLLPLYIKKAMRKDPFFENIKVVVSLYDECFEEEFPPDFAKQILITGVRSRDVELLAPPNYVNLMKVAIANADGVVAGSANIHPQLQEFMAKRRTITLPYCQQPDLQAKEYAAFYEKIINR